MSFKSLPAACRLGRVAMLAVLVVATAGAVVFLFLDALPRPAAILASLTLILAALPLLLACTAARRSGESGGDSATSPSGGAAGGKGQSEQGSGAVLLPALASKLQLLCGLMRELNHGSTADSVAAVQTPKDVARKDEGEPVAPELPEPAVPAATSTPATAVPAITDTAPTGAQAPDQAAGESGRVDAAVREMETIAATVDRAALQIKQLLAELHRVSSITAVIGEVAIQAELLALNAAVEAARSGPRGRNLAGSAMVAREVTRRAGATTERIEQTIRAIQLEAGGAESAIAQVGTQVRRGVEMVQSGGGGREAVAGGEPPGAPSIAEQMERIAQIVEGSSASMRSAAAATAELERLAQVLSETISAFRA